MHDRELQYVLAYDPSHRVEAFQITEERHLPLRWERSSVPKWLFNGLYRAPEVYGSVFIYKERLWVHGPFGQVSVDVNDWIVCDNGHLHVCYPEKFQDLYRPRSINYRFQKKPVIIEAFQMTTERFQDQRDWPTWLVDAWDLGPSMGGFEQDLQTRKFLTHTLEGSMTVNDGDWIIRGLQGELYPCKPEIFSASYVEVT